MVIDILFLLTIVFLRDMTESKDVKLCNNCLGGSKISDSYESQGSGSDDFESYSYNGLDMNSLGELKDMVNHEIDESFALDWDYVERGRYEKTPKGSNRIILSYNWNECKNKNQSSNRRYLKESKGPEQNRNYVMRELSRLASNYISKKLMNEDIQSQELGIHGFGSNQFEKSVSAEIRTRYLSYLDMELITNYSPKITNGELKNIAAQLPCIEKAFLDEDKYRSRMNDDIMISTDIKNETLYFESNISGTNDSAVIGDSMDMNVHNVNEVVKETESKKIRGYSRSEKPWNMDDNSPFSISPGIGWKSTKANRNPFTIAIIDSGCDMNHSRLRNKKWMNPGEICDDGIDNDTNGFIDDCHGWDFVNNTNNPIPGPDGHGTGAAGIVAGDWNGPGGKISVCPNCNIMCLKFIDGNHGSVSNQIQAIDYALSMGVRVSNNSYGGYSYAEAEYEAVKRAEAAGHLFVASAGNHASNTDLPGNYHTPSGYPLSNIISVGASDRWGKKAVFSNYGSRSVHIFAPGTDIIVLAPGDKYYSAMGTSFASPHIAGMAAVLWSSYPKLSMLQLRQAILDGCGKSPLMYHQSYCGGHGNLKNSMLLADNMMRDKKLRNSVHDDNTRNVQETLLLRTREMLNPLTNWFVS